MDLMLTSKNLNKTNYCLLYITSNFFFFNLNIFDFVDPLILIIAIIARSEKTLYLYLPDGSRTKHVNARLVYQLTKALHRIINFCLNNKVLSSKSMFLIPHLYISELGELFKSCQCNNSELIIIRFCKCALGSKQMPS